MARGLARVRSTDLTRALIGFNNAGIEVDRVEIDRDGLIKVIPKPPKALPPPTIEASAA
jgi:hypothetical protein